MCKYCNQSSTFLLMDEFIKDIGFADKVTQEDMHIFQDDYFVFIDRGYLRLVDTDSDCLDHGVKIKIKFCPVCGVELKEK